MSVQLKLPEYWIARPGFTLTLDEATYFEKVQGDISRSSLPIAEITLPSHIHKWHFLDWLVQKGGVLLHGSVNPNIALFSPRTPNDHSADEFSKQTAVYATTDSIWSIYYATLDRSHGQRHLNACLQFQSGQSWSDLYYFFSLDRQAHIANPWRPGYVYLLPSVGFVQQPPYEVQNWTVLDPHFANQKPVTPFARLRVEPSDFPLLDRVRQHNDEEIIQAQKQEPLAFPWLSSETSVL